MIGKIINKLRRDKKMTLSVLATKTGIDIGHLSHIEKAERYPSYKTLKLICNALDVPVSQIANYTGKELNEEQDSYGYIEYIPYNLIPVIDIKEYVKSPVNTDKNVMAVLAKDDSMSPTIKKGDTVLVEFFGPINKKDLGLFLLNGDILMREFNLKDNKIVLKAYNNEYGNYTICDEDKFSIIGRIIKK